MDQKISQMSDVGTPVNADIIPIVDSSTNKSVSIKELRTKRTISLTDAATVTINVDLTDVGILSSLSQTTTIANPTGTPADNQSLIIRITSSSSQTLSFGNQFNAGSSIPLPTSTTGSSKTDYFSFIWDAATSKWNITGNALGF
jgi:hypothetical protein